MEIFINKEQREQHIKMLLYIAHLDGEFTSSEEEYISALAKLYGVSGGFVENEKNTIKEKSIEYFDKILNSLSGTLGKKEKRCLIQDTISISCADGNFSEKEVSFIKELAKKLEVDQNISNKILDLNLQTMHLSKQLADTLLIND